MTFKTIICGETIKGNCTIDESLIDKTQKGGIYYCKSKPTYFYQLDFVKLLTRQNDLYNLIKLWTEKELLIKDSDSYILKETTLGATFNIMPQNKDSCVYKLGIVDIKAGKELILDLKANIFDVNNCNKMINLTEILKVSNPVNEDDENYQVIIK